jgi:hypothetical protein
MCRGVVVKFELWEWGVRRAMRSNPVGVSMTRHGAMAALSRALVESGQPGRGSVGPVILVREAQSGSHYLRLPVTNAAVCEQGVVRWDGSP